MIIHLRFSGSPTFNAAPIFRMSRPVSPWHLFAAVTAEPSAELSSEASEEGRVMMVGVVATRLSMGYPLVI